MNEYSYADIFHTSEFAPYVRVGEDLFPVGVKVRVNFIITDRQVGKKFGCSEVYSGNGSQTCKLVLDGKKISEKGVGSGQMFQTTIKADHIGEGYFDYWQNSPEREFRYLWECYML